MLSGFIEQGQNKFSFVLWDRWWFAYVLPWLSLLFGSIELDKINALLGYEVNIDMLFSDILLNWDKMKVRLDRDE